MNASYFLNAPYSLNPQNPRALARVQTPPSLKDIEVGGCVCTQVTKPSFRKRCTKQILEAHCW